MRGLWCDGLQDGAEDAGVRREAGGAGDGAHVRLALSGLHRAIAVGDLALDHGLAVVISLPLWGILLIGGLVAEAWLERASSNPRSPRTDSY